MKTAKVNPFKVYHHSIDRPNKYGVTFFPVDVIKAPQKIKITFFCKIYIQQPTEIADTPCNDAPSCNDIPCSSQYKGPVFPLYHDSAVVAADNTGNLPIELRHRIIRSTLSMMISITSQEPFKRYPLTGELEEMAKSLCIKYNSLKDAVTGHVSIIKLCLCSLYKVQISHQFQIV